MQRTMLSGVICLVAVLVAGCSMPVLKQDIPVSTNPLGAKVYANGQLMGATPMTVSLERNRSHILTLVKDNYRQEDVVITNRYQREKVYLKAIQSGINSGLFFKSGAMGVGSSMSSFSAQEDSGEAYVLYPPAVTVNLTPLSGAVPAAAGRTSRSVQPAADGDMQAPSPGTPEMAKDLLKVGLGAAASQMAPVEKKVTSSSSTKNYVRADGTRVQEKTSSSASVGINPAGLIDAIDTLFK